MVRLIIVTATLLLSSYIAIGQVAKDSLKFHKTGIYTYKDKYNEVFIKRTRTKQIEYNKDKSKVLVLNIKWVSDDEYWLTFIKEKNFPGCLKKGYILKSKITYADRNQFSCKYESDHCGNGEATFIKIE